MKCLIDKNKQLLMFFNCIEFRDGVVLLTENTYIDKKCYLVRILENKVPVTDKIVWFYDSDWGAITGRNVCDKSKSVEILEVYTPDEMIANKGLFRYWTDELRRTKKDTVILILDGSNAYFCGFDKDNTMIVDQDVTKAIRYDGRSDQLTDIFVMIVQKTGHVCVPVNLSDVCK